jgi:PAS domain-containing protein
MKKRKAMRGLSDVQLLAFIESLPAGMALVDEGGQPVWANRLARQLLPLRATTSPSDDTGTALAVLIGQLIAALPPFRTEEHVRWTVTGGGVVEATLRRMWGSQVALWLTPSVEIAQAPAARAAADALTTWQLIVAERMLEESVVGLVAADSSGAIAWMNAHARRLLGGAAKRVGRDAQRDVARAARHVADGQLVAPIRMRFDLPARSVEAQFWNVAPGLAGVRFDEEEKDARAFWRDRLIA